MHVQYCRRILKIICYTISQCDVTGKMLMKRVILPRLFVDLYEIALMLLYIDIIFLLYLYIKATLPPTPLSF